MIDAAGEAGRDDAGRSLVARAKQRDPEAWSHIYLTYHPLIYRYARARVFDPEAAEDIASAVFMAALQGIDAYRDRGRPLLAWFYGIARKLVADHQRKLLRQGAFGFGPFRWPATHDSTPTPQSMEDAEWTGEPPEAMAIDEPGDILARLDLSNAIRRLTEGQREVIILRFFVGLSVVETATITAKKPAAVYSIEARALMALRKELQ